ncbi:MAG: hypothetical protein WBW78_16970, partial [Terrimicrobiaceae bacterium]
DDKDRRGRVLAPRLLPIRASSPLNANPLGEMRPHASVMAAALLSFQSRDVPDTAGNVRHAAINRRRELFGLETHRKAALLHKTRKS